MAVAQVTEETTKLAASLISHNSAMQTAIQTGGPSLWFRPVDWDGNVYDIAALGIPFNRTPLYTQFREAVNGQSSGTTGDMMAIAVQGDNLAVAERAFRARHATSVRNKMHAAGRHRGHANVNGVINNGQGNYLKQLIQLGAG